jgi:hypothetical protein
LGGHKKIKIDLTKLKDCVTVLDKHAPEKKAEPIEAPVLDSVDDKLGEDEYLE